MNRCIAHLQLCVEEAGELRLGIGLLEGSGDLVVRAMSCDSIYVRRSAVVLRRYSHGDHIVEVGRKGACVSNAAISTKCSDRSFYHGSWKHTYSIAFKYDCIYMYICIHVCMYICANIDL